ncbi:DUF6194 family protein [Brevibacterium atlanticum]|uniref:DUF6194 family protein n=1 Tax=Brevibacterium atlanticum TaxID=2697563 RepID=UPI00141E2180|nr:DUF6194 family protein [Brevibacterium atlanticum]
MSMEQILSEVRTYDGLLELAPTRGSQHPEISWGDYFFYYAPDGQVPRNRQPYATIVTKDYPGDAESRLDAADRWRLNIHVGAQAFAELLGSPPEEIDESEVDYSVTDTFLPHPLYGASGWVCIVNPGNETLERALAAVYSAHLADRRRVERRQGRGEDLPSE